MSEVDFNKAIEAIENAPKGKQIAALFDFDGTIIQGFSATVFLKEQLKRRQMSILDLAEMFSVVAEMARGKANFSAMMATAARLVSGTTEASYRELGEDIFETQIKDKIYANAIKIIEAHKAAGLIGCCSAGLKKNDEIGVLAAMMTCQRDDSSIF